MALVLGLVSGAQAQPVPAARQFSIGALNRLDELPAGPFRSRLEQLPATARGRALQWLRSFHFPEADVASLHADDAGGICYVCQFSLPAMTEPEEVDEESPPIAQAAVPVSPFPGSLVFHSRPGSPNVLYLNFAGEDVTNTEWNTSLGRSVIPALPFSSDTDFSTFSDSEQAVIRRVWQRVAEDYAPFDINVTTERPASFNNRTAMALITRDTDANGAPNPSNSGGGVAYVNVFGSTSFARYRPAWVYHDNLSNGESYIAEAASHEIGHNLGLSHDGTSGSSYYGGHGSGDISWGPLMGTGYNRNVSQWSKGEYYQANNTQDDLATIAGKLSYRTDDHGGTPGGATSLVLSGGTNIVATTP
ncbi:MAG TPA: M12 family metallo-peptidase, partial [Verrucomicrobiae bacterium]|nr:M12 family metallo-peptidase [Verrucomicrobiae bacterium]